jgi:hypothetical protein
LKNRAAIGSCGGIDKAKGELQMRQIVRDLSGRYGRAVVSAGVAVAVVLAISLAAAMAGSRQVPGAHAASAVSTPVNYMVANLGVTGGNEQSPVQCPINNNFTSDVAPIASFSWGIKSSAGVITSSPVVLSAPADWYTPLIEVNLVTAPGTPVNICLFHQTAQTYTRVEDYVFNGCLVSAVSSAVTGGGATDTFTLTACQSVRHTVYFGHGSKNLFVCFFTVPKCGS